MRRHAHSCDQCRRSKRACDAAQLVLPEGAEAKGPTLLNRNLQPPKTEPCSYCKKTGKTCTMNWAWSQLQLHTAMEAASRGEFQNLETGPDTTTAQKRSRNDIDNTQPDPTYQPENTTYEYFEQNLSSYDPNTIIDFPFPSAIHNHQPNMMHAAPHSAPPLFHNQPPPNMGQQIPPGMFNVNNNFNPNMPPEPAYSDFNTPADMTNHSFTNSGAVSDPLSFAFPATMSPSTASNITSIDQPASDFGFSMSGNSNTMFGTSAESAYDGVTRSHRSADDVDERIVAKKRRTPGSWTENRRSSMSPYSADQTMMKLCTQGIISSSLLQVYHDVLEHNMSCWLTEATCPYDGAWCPQEGRLTAEWGSSWSNRIFDRTMKLDMASKGNGLVKLTKSQDNAANRAMNMAVMAFASQWAQGSKRKDELYQPRKHKLLKDEGSQDPFADLADEFDRNLQRHFWNEAQKALNDVSDIESYKVICAEIVFGFSQKPWTQDEIQHSLDKTEKAFKSESAFDMSDLLSEVTRCIDMDGPPVYMERATRKMQNLKIKNDAAAQALAKKTGTDLETARNSLLSSTDQTTASLLYWLAVMADTISSGMNQRPITVSDEDSMHDLTDDDDMLKGRWKLDLFIKDDLSNPTKQFHWPCSYEDAAEAIAHASPVKICLWRSINHLQGLLRRKPNAAKIEELVSTVISIWKYWNQTYGQFFRELVHSVEKVPVRIRSWFFCVSAHWHLAAFLMVELIESIDEQDLGIPAQKKERAMSRIVATMRQTSVAEVADLGKISLPKSESEPAPVSVLTADPSTMPEFEPEFHHAVKEGTILTEPWTIILVRVFSRAAMVMLGEMDRDRQYGALTSDDKTWISMQRTEYCIKTLFYLGKKSDMSRRVADVLSEAQQALKEAIIGGSVAQNSMFDGQQGYPRMPVPTA